MDYYDLYVLCKQRILTNVYVFLKKYLREWEALSVDYGYPQYEDCVKKAFDNYSDLLDYLDKNPNTEYTLYFKGKNGRIATVRFNKDNSLVLGLSISEKELNWYFFDDLEKNIEFEFAYVTLESPPVDSADEFIKVTIASKFWVVRNSSIYSPK